MGKDKEGCDESFVSAFWAGIIFLSVLFYE